MRRFFILFAIIALFNSTIFAQNEQNRQKERDQNREERTKEMERQRAIDEASRAEFEAQRAYEEARRMKEMEEHLRAQHQDLQKVLTDLHSKERSTYNKVLYDLYNQWDNLKALEEENKELAELETKVRAAEIKLAMQEKEYQKLRSSDQKDKVKTELKNQLEKLFELKVKKRKMEINSLRDELKKLEDELDNIQKNKNTSIKMKLQQMTEGDIFTW